MTRYSLPMPFPLAVLALCGCGADLVDARGEQPTATAAEPPTGALMRSSGSAELGAVALQGGFSSLGCSASQIEKLRAGLAHVKAMHDGGSLLNCLNDAFLEGIWTGGKIAEYFNERAVNPAPIAVYCVNELPAEATALTQCEQIGQIKILNVFVDTATPEAVGALLFHEALHTEGYCFKHGATAQSGSLWSHVDYQMAMPNLVQSCIELGAPPGDMRRSKLAGPVGTGWLSQGPSMPDANHKIVESLCPAGTVMTAIRTQSGDASHITTGEGWFGGTKLRQVVPVCSSMNGSGWMTSGPVLGAAKSTDVQSSLACDPGYVFVTVAARHNLYGGNYAPRFTQLSGTCVLFSQIGVVSHTSSAYRSQTVGSTFGLASDSASSRSCRSGRVMVGLRGLIGLGGDYLQGLEPVCRPAGEINAPWPALSGVGGAPTGGLGGSPYTLRCPGNTTAEGFTGGVGAHLDRVGLLCVDLSAPGTPRAPSETAGGTGGAIFTAGCGRFGDAVVGFDASTNGSVVDGIRPVCANAASWRAGVPTVYPGTPASGWERRLCQRSVLAGLTGRSGNLVDRVQPLCLP